MSGKEALGSKEAFLCGGEKKKKKPMHFAFEMQLVFGELADKL